MAITVVDCVCECNVLMGEWYLVLSVLAANCQDICSNCDLINFALSIPNKTLLTTVLWFVKYYVLEFCVGMNSLLGCRVDNM